MKILSVILLFLTMSSFAQEGRNISEYNLDSAGRGLIHHINGKAYDPVSFFTEGTGLVGKPEFSLLHEGVTYLFASEENKLAFKQSPQKYEPTYGGWCARAMVVGQKIGIDPKYFTIHGNRIHFFVNNRAKRFFDRNLSKNEAQADQEWKRISGEDPRK